MGSEIYKEFLPYAHRLYITHIFHSFKADVFFLKLMINENNKGESTPRKY